ncbi:MAG: DUF1566 domain-containing protein [Chitinophagales bacterium]
MSYQAVVRDNANNLVTSNSIGIRIQILQGSEFGGAVYVETHTSTTNANGLMSLEIGNGTVVSGNFITIDWTDGPYFIKTETDPTGGTNYSISSTSQLLSVPYALHAKKADSVSGGITETDPVYTGSQASNITAIDIANLSNLSGMNTGDQDISGISNNQQAIQDTASQIRSDIPDVSGFISNETDPLFSSSVASGITGTDTTYWNNKLDSYTETDPIFGTSVASGITGTDTTYWNNKQDQLVAGTNIAIVGNTISAAGGSSSNDFYLGQDTLGGIVFYIYLDQNGDQHGLIVNKNESTAQWQSSFTTTNATRSWDGVYNTILMTGSPAATYVNGLTDGGFTDWYLPSIDELSILWHNRFHANKALNAGSFALLSNTARYWSSTEYNASDAFYFLSYGYSNNGNKTSTYSVRAVRAF